MQISAADGRATLTLLDDGLIRLTYAPNTEVTAVDAEDILEQSLTLANDTSYAILVDMSPILHMSLEARALFGSEHKVLAAAMLGHTPMDQVIAASLTQSVHNVQFFTDENTALTWLTSHLPDTTHNHRRGPGPVPTTR